MEKRILLPVADVEHAVMAAELAGELFPKGTLVLLHVINPAEAGFSTEATIPSFPNGWYEKQTERAESLFDSVVERVDSDGMSVERHVELGKPIRSIVDFANDAEVDHIVMGSECRQGVSRLVLGSIAEGVIRRSSVPVTVAK